MPIISQVRRTAGGGGKQETKKRGETEEQMGGQIVRKIVFIRRWSESLKIGGNEMDLNIIVG